MVSPTSSPRQAQQSPTDYREANPQIKKKLKKKNQNPNTEQITKSKTSNQLISTPEITKAKANLKIEQ